MNEPQTKSAGVPVNIEEKNPLERFGEAISRQRIVGDLLRFNKSEWVVGRELEELPEGLKLIAGVHMLEAGWIMWQELRPVDFAMGNVLDGFLPPRRAELGMLNPLEWPRDARNDRPRDPWQQSFSMPLLGEDKKIYTYATASAGGRKALGRLAAMAGKRLRLKPTELPVVRLKSEWYRHSDRQIGKVYNPVFEVLDWKVAIAGFNKALQRAAEQQAEQDEVEEDERAEIERPRGKPAHEDYPAERPSRKRMGKPAEAGDDEDDIPF